MRSSRLNGVVVVLLGAASLCGCATDPRKASASAQAPGPSPARLPRDPVIDAYVGAMRADLSDGKVQIINRVMNLSTKEGQVFWPIYEAYESELFDLGDQRVDL